MQKTLGPLSLTSLPLLPSDNSLKNTRRYIIFRGTWLAQSMEHTTLYLEVMSWNPTWGIEIAYKKKDFHSHEGFILSNKKL